MSRRIATQLAAKADVDLRSAIKALAEGAAAVKGRAGERIAEAAAANGIALPCASNAASKAADI